MQRSPTLEFTDLPERWRAAAQSEGMTCRGSGSDAGDIRDRITEAMPPPTRIEVPQLAIEIPTWSRERKHGVDVTLHQPCQKPRDLTPLPMNRPTMPTPPSAATKIDPSTVLDRVERLTVKTPLSDTAVRN
jgi:hypothetical protein